MKKFENGAAFIVTEADYKLHPNIGHANKFVSNVESIEQVVRDANKNIEHIENALGLTKKLGEDLNKIYIIYIKPNQIKNPRIPDGNEGGANKFWIPGGCTASEDAMGIPEIVIDCTELPKTKFNYEKYKNLITLEQFYNIK